MQNQTEFYPGPSPREYTKHKKKREYRPGMKEKQIKAGIKNLVEYNLKRKKIKEYQESF